MAQPVIQTSFNAGEWAPALNSRVDLQKYHTGAALLRNFFVDYRGGATARAGTRYVLQTRSTATVRLIPFQASFTVSYTLEFGSGYVRFYNNGAPVLEPTKAITAVNIGTSTITSAAHGYSNGDWVFLTGIVGTLGAQLNGNFYIVAGATTNTYTLTDLNGVAIVFTGAYTSGGTSARIYTIASPYQANELAQIKFAQNVSVMVICHPNYPPYQLTLIAATNWTLAAISFGSTIAAPTGQTVTTTLAAGTVNYAYVITAVDANGQESPVSAFAVLASVTDIRSVAGTNTVTWSAVTGAVSYNIYRAEPRYGAAVPAGSTFGFMGNVTGVSFIDSNVTPDFSSGPPVVENPFFGSGVQTINVTAPGSIGPGAPVPTVSFSGGGGSGAAALATLQVIAAAIVSQAGAFIVGDLLTNPTYNVIIQVTAVNGFGHITGLAAYSGTVNSGLTPANPVGFYCNRVPSFSATANLTWGLGAIALTSPGTNYTTPPAVAISSGGGTATAVLGAPSSGNPTVPGYIQQRLALMGPVSSPQQFNYSSTGAYYNFNVHNPIEADDAIQGTLVTNQLNTIKAMIPQPYGHIILSDKQAWLLNGGSNGSPLSPLTITANSQAYNGAADLPPIIANDNILYVQAKGSIVRDLVYNYYTQVYTGADISVLSSHLFYGFTLLEWAWAEEPFKIVWAVRNDGILLSLTFLKEQELIAWAHSDTQGSFRSIATVTEQVAVGSVDAIYTVVQRTINGNTVQYVERMAELYYPVGTTDAWCVDAGIQYNGAAALTFSGAQHLAGAVVTGLATDDLGNVTVINLTMPTNGTFTLPAPTPVGSTGYTRVTVGLGYLPQLQTLQLDLGEPTVQGKRKKITGVTTRCKDTLGLSIGRTFSTLTPMKDLALGNVGTQTNQLVTGLVTGDARTIIDPLWDTPGQYCIQQPFPYPASILGVIPEIVVGDTK